MEKINVRTFEAFAGYGSQCTALERLKNKYKDIFDFEVVGISEIEPNAINAYNAIHGETKNYGDISQVETCTLPDFDLFTYSFPCFIEGTLVLTENGYKPIEEITCNDRVLTHNNRFKKVVKPMINKADHIYKIKNMGSEDLYVTEEHPFYVRRKYQKNGEKLFDKPEWIKTKNLSKDYYLGIAINQNAELPKWEGIIPKWSNDKNDKFSIKLSKFFDKNDFWWIIGKYINDGWIRSSDSIIISCNFSEIFEIASKLDNIRLDYSITTKTTINKIHINLKDIGEYCEQFGRSVSNKHLTGDILNLPKDLLKSFLDGYMSTGSCFTQNLNTVSSVSKELIYGIGQCIAKVYNRPFSIGTIEGGLISQKESFYISWKNNSNKLNKAFYEDNYIWIPINNIEKLEYDGLVYNIEVEDDNSYTANGIIVHNCTDISSLGKKMGFKEGSGTRSSLLWECKKVINIKKPKYLLLENVAELINNDNLPLFKIWLQWLDEQGYTTYYKIINSMDFGVPQSRNRVFAISFLGEHEPYIFPEGTKELVTLDNILEDEVDDKYYTNKKYYYIKKTKSCKICKDSDCKRLCDCGYKPELKIHTNKMECFYNKQSVDDIDNKKFKELINHQLNKLNITYNDIKKELGLKSSDRIKKWFLEDNKYPKVSEWKKVKEILQIDTNEFDCIGETHLEPIKFNMVKSVRHHTGVHGTIVCNDTLFSVQIPRTRFEKGKTYHKCRQINPLQGDIEYCNDCIYYEQRLLTPREFWRLMDMSDEDYDKVVATGISEKMMYKLAGNSIVVSVLESLFESMFIPKELRK